MKKKLIQLVLYLIFALPLCGLAAHRYLPLRFEITGINNATANKNANTSVENFHNSLTFPFTESEIRRFYKKSPTMIQKALMPFGYFRSHVQSNLLKNKQFWMASFHVTPGPTLPVTAINIQITGPGKNDSAFLDWKKNITLKVGQALNTPDYEKTKNELNNIATEHGYFAAKFIKKQIQIDLSHYVAHIVIVFNTGPRYRFGKTTFSDSLFHNSFLQKFLRYKSGENYEASQLEETQSGLVATNYFNQVTIRTDLQHAKNHIIPIKIKLIARKAKEYTLGMGYGTDTGVRGTIGVTLRNIGHIGHRFQTLLRASQTNSSLTAKYLIPGIDPARDLLTFATGIGNINQSTGTARNAKVGATYTFSRGHWRHSFTLAYLTERYNLTKLPKTSTSLVFPTLESQYLILDSKTNPSKGLRLSTQITGASKDALSQTNFFQITAQLSTLYTFPTHTRFLFRTHLGHTSIAHLSELPLSLQLFAGGTRSVRGYGYNAIGPGRNIVTASTELQQRVYGNFYATGFIDAGVVGNQHLLHHINAGTGPGIAWISSVGTIELTVANAFTQHNKPWTIQFTMGTFV